MLLAFIIIAAKFDEDEEVIEFDEDEDDDDDEDEEVIDEVGDEFKRLLLFVVISVVGVIGVGAVGVCWFSGLGFSELFSVELVDVDDDNDEEVSDDTDAAPTNDVTAFDMFFV